MKVFIATFWRMNPLFANGGYTITHTIEAEDIDSAREQAKEIMREYSYDELMKLVDYSVGMSDEAAVTIERHVGCDRNTAKMIFNGVWKWNGDYYSARFVEGDKLEICKNGFPIHLISHM